MDLVIVEVIIISKQSWVEVNVRRRVLDLDGIIVNS